MRRACALVVLLAAGVASAETDAADPDALDPDLVPKLVHVTLHGQSAELTAHFSIHVAEATFEQGARTLHLPDEAVVTEATATVAGVAHHLKLMPAEDASRAMDEIAENTAGPHPQWAIRLAISDPTNLVVDLAAGAKGRIDLELRLEMPTCFDRDARHLALPPDWFAHLDAPRPHIDSTTFDRSACGSGTADAEWITFPAGELAKKPAGEARLGMLAGLLPLGAQQISKVELDVSTKLTDVPRDLYTAILIDRSRSLNANEIEVERALVASYLQHVPPQSRVQIIAYARDAKALLPAWLPAGATAPRIDREVRALAPRNGSNVDRGIVEATAWLGKVKGTKRLIIVTDENFAGRIDDLSTHDLEILAPPDTLVHIVDVSLKTDGLERNDELQLGPLAKITEGMGVGAGLDAHKTLDATMLVHPISIDRVTVSGAGWTNLEQMTTCVDQVGAGRSCAWWGLARSVAAPLSVEGFLWGHRVKRLLRPDPMDGVHLARELSTSMMFDEELTALVDRAAMAVNSAWSLFATWGGSNGYEGGTGGGSGFGGSCCQDGIVGDIGHGTGTGRRLELEPQLRPVIAGCHASAATVDIKLETTFEEIVDVAVDVTPANDAQQQCIVDGIWDLSLSIADAPIHNSARFKIKP